MKRIYLLILSIMFVLASCNQNSIPETGSLSILLPVESESQDYSRAIGSRESITYKITLAHEAGGEITLSGKAGQKVQIESLNAGKYTISVEGYMAELYQIYEGEKSAVIKAGTNNEVSIKLSYTNRTQSDHIKLVMNKGNIEVKLSLKTGESNSIWKNAVVEEKFSGLIFDMETNKNGDAYTVNALYPFAKKGNYYVFELTIPGKPSETVFIKADSDSIGEIVTSNSSWESYKCEYGYSKESDADDAADVLKFYAEEDPFYYSFSKQKITAGSFDYIELHLIATTKDKVQTIHDYEESDIAGKIILDLSSYTRDGLVEALKTGIAFSDDKNKALKKDSAKDYKVYGYMKLKGKTDTSVYMTKIISASKKK